MYRTRKSLIEGSVIFLLAISTYFLMKPLAKSILFDIFQCENKWFTVNEPFAFIIFITLATALASYIRYHIVKNKKDEGSILSEIEEDTYAGSDLEKIKKYYNSVIKKNFSNTPKKFTVISKRYPKSVYAITGGWRAGKTSAAGTLIDILRKKQKIKSEIYHDTFNFGNVNESISSFFNVLADKTEIYEFKDLGKVSTPGMDMEFGIGPLKFKKAIDPALSANKIRQRIFEKLSRDDRIHIIVIDDIDRLLPEEQILWLRVIELLGKFNNKLIVLVPIHILQVGDALMNLEIPTKYLQKILPNQVQIGADIDFIKSKFQVNESNSQQTREKYAKYIVSLMIRMAISRLISGKVNTLSEWGNDFAVGNFSTLAQALQQKLTFHNTSNELRGTELVRIDQNENLWTDEVAPYEKNVLARLITDGFVAPRSFADTSDLGRKEINFLKSKNVLDKIFRDIKFTRAEKSPAPTLSDSSEWASFWGSLVWSAIDDVEGDPHISEYFQYDQISDEIDLLLTSDDGAEDEIIKQWILTWNKN